MQVCPPLLIAPQTAPSAAEVTSASSSTIIASLPPSSMSTGVSVSAQADMTVRPVGAEPVNASLSTGTRHSAAPVAPKPVTTWKASAQSGTAARHEAASQAPIAGVCSEGLKTTALPAASEYAIEPIGVN